VDRNGFGNHEDCDVKPGVLPLERQPSKLGPTTEPNNDFINHVRVDVLGLVGQQVARCEQQMSVVETSDKT
jgi:hypothetical protein